MKYKNFELKNDQDSFLTLVDEEGNEELCQIIFTFESEELGKKYVIFSRVSDIEKYYSTEDAEDEKIEVGAARYIEGEDGTGELLEIETEEEWELIEEALECFDNEMSEHEHCGCGCGHHGEYCCDDECDCDCDCECEEDEEEEHCCCCHKHEE
jgi:uncharacterized protein YrzB (UPF0473 family)